MTASDDFNRANGGLGAGWASGGLSATLAIASNQVVAGGDADAVSIAAGTWGNDHASQLKVINAPSGTSTFVGVGCRLSGSGGSLNGYVYLTDDSTPGGAAGIYKVTAGVFTLLTSTFSGRPAANDTIKIDCVGTTLTAYVNGVSVASTTDATYTSGSPGIYLYGTSGFTATGDDWAGADIGGGGSAKPAPYYARMRNQ